MNDNTGGTKRLFRKGYKHNPLLGEIEFCNRIVTLKLFGSLKAVLETGRAFAEKPNVGWYLELF